MIAKTGRFVSICRSTLPPSKVSCRPKPSGKIPSIDKLYESIWPMGRLRRQDTFVFQLARLNSRYLLTAAAA